MLECLAAFTHRLRGSEAVSYYARARQTLRPDKTRTQASAPSVYVEHGGGGYVALPNGLLIGGGGGGGGQRANVGAYRRIAGHGFGMFMLGYVLGQSPRTRFYPYIGIGGGGEGIVLSKRDMLLPGEAVARRARDRIADGAGGPMLHLGFGVELRFGGGVGFMVGLQVGTAFALLGRPRRYIRLLLGGRAGARVKN